MDKSQLHPETSAEDVFLRAFSGVVLEFNQFLEGQADSPAGTDGYGLFIEDNNETVAQKIAWAARMLGLSRFQLKYSVGSLPHDQRMESVRLYGEEVIPRVRELLAGADS